MECPINFDDQMGQIPWPFHIRRSLKARSMKIYLKTGEPIEVVYPRWSNRQQALRFLQQNVSWIKRQTAYLQSLKNNNRASFPKSVYFPCLQKRWKVVRLDNPFTNKPRCREQSGELVLMGSEFVEERQWIGLLKAWMKRIAIEYLEPRFVKLSMTNGFHFSRVQWRCQKTRWGSCSHLASISLNVKLLFLPSSLVEYVMLHELCHTRFLNHGSGFGSC